MKRSIGAFWRGPWTRLVVLLTLAVAVAACTPPEPIPLPERPDIPFGQGRIWQIDREGLEPSYAFGTMHVDDRRVMDLPPAAEAAFAKAEIAAFELLREDEDAVIDELYETERLRLSGDQDLEDLIGPVSFGILRWHLNQRELAPNADIKPWVMWLYVGGENLGYVDYERLQPSGHNMILDDWLESRARDAGKEVVGLESPQEQFDIYDKMPLEHQANLLKLTLDHYSKRKAQAPKFQFYLDGDLAMFVALWDDYLSRLEPETAAIIDDRLITDRNRIMVERMLPLMRRGSTFVAVGAAHMPGEEGILRLLEQQGYTVTRLH